MASRFTRPISTFFLYASLPIVTLNYIRVRLLLGEEEVAAIKDVEKLESKVVEKAKSLNLLRPASIFTDPNRNHTVQ